MASRTGPPLRLRYFVLRTAAGHLQFAIIDIPDARELWDANWVVMQDAILLYKTIVCHEGMQHRAYLISQSADCLVMAFPEQSSAAEFAHAVTMRLLDAPWPERLKDLDKAAVVALSISDDTLAFRGLRPRLVITSGPSTWVMHKVPPSPPVMYQNGRTPSEEGGLPPPPPLPPLPLLIRLCPPSPPPRPHWSSHVRCGGGQPPNFPVLEKTA